jgi:hypothetical protein
MTARASRRGRATALVLATLPVAALGATAPGETPAPCLSSAELTPAEAVVGQQVLYQLRILSREDVDSVEWVEPPSFPGFRAERLPGRPADSRVERGGVAYRVREEHRALFPERPGALVVQRGRLRCRVRERGAARTHQAPVPPVTLRAVAPPERDRPPDFSGLIGPLALTATVEPRSIAVGESARLTVVARGGGNLWLASDPMAGESRLAGAELFRRRPSLTLERGVRLFVRREFRYELVPRRVGALTVPEIRVPYFDPDSGRYAAASAAAMELRVRARPGAPSEPGGSARGSSGVRSAPEEGEEGIDPRAWVLVAGTLLVAAAVARSLLRRRRRGGARAALAAADVSRASGDASAEAAALAEALRAALLPHVPDLRSTTAEELLARAPHPPAVTAAVQLLAEVERSRFDPDAEIPDRAAVEGAVAAL